MNIVNKTRAAIFSAILLPIATQAHVASAAVFCRAFWPATITQCANTLSGTIQDSGTGSGTNVTVGSTNRKVTVTWVAGTVSAQAGALNSQGQAIAGCSITDGSKVDGSRSVNCFTADPPAAFFMTAD